MLLSGWFFLAAVLQTAMAASECLVGCMLQGISPFDEDNEVVWDDREACDSTTIGCEVSALNYPSTAFFVGALWASVSGVDGSSDCTCSMCDPYPGSSYASYMEEVSLWSRIQCFIAASEESGYDMSPCVAAIVDTGTLPCVDDVYQEPLVGQFECDDNDFTDLSSSSSHEECSWAGDARQAAEMFPAISEVSSSATSSSECLVGCMLQGISPFDEDDEVVWDDREACDSTTIGCEVSALNYPSVAFFVGALWASTSGVDGSSDCTCSMCDPYPGSSYTTYMSEEVSLWSRIQCFIAASEESGYDMSPCVAAILDTGTLLCVDEVYEAPLVDQFECDDNDFTDLSSSSSHEECSWAGDARQAAELFAGTTVVTSPTSPAPSALGMTPTPGPVPVPTTVATPIPVEAAATAPTLIPAADVPPGNPTIAPTTGGAVSDSGSSSGGSSPGPAPTPTPVAVAPTAPSPAVDVTPGNPTIAPTTERAVPDNGSGSDGSGLPTLDPTPAPTTPASSPNGSFLSGTVAPTIPGDTSGDSSSFQVLEVLAYIFGGFVFFVGGRTAFVKFNIKSKFVACRNIVHCDSITCQCCHRGCCPPSTTVGSDVHDPNTRR